MTALPPRSVTTSERTRGPGHLEPEASQRVRGCCPGTSPARRNRTQRVRHLAAGPVSRVPPSEGVAEACRPVQIRAKMAACGRSLHAEAGAVSRHRRTAQPLRSAHAPPRPCASATQSGTTWTVLPPGPVRSGGLGPSTPRGADRRGRSSGTSAGAVKACPGRGRAVRCRRTSVPSRTVGALDVPWPAPHLPIRQGPAGGAKRRPLSRPP